MQLSVFLFPLLLFTPTVRSEDVSNSTIEENTTVVDDVTTIETETVTDIVNVTDDVSNVTTTTLAPVPEDDGFVHFKDDLCFCDLLINSCDVNCCCDLDCSSEDRHVFSKCLMKARPPVNINYCTITDYIYKNNTEYKVTTTKGGLYCVETNNVVETVFYAPKKVVTHGIDFESVVSGSTVASWSSSQEKKSMNFKGEKYKHGLPLWKVEGKDIKYFTIPSSLLTSSCSIPSPVNFLHDGTSTCTQTITTSSSAGGGGCGGEGVSVKDLVGGCLLARGHMYHEDVEPTLEKSENASETTTTPNPIINYNDSCTTINKALVKINLCICLDKQCENCTELETVTDYLPQRKGNICENIVSEVLYVFHYIGSNIVSVESKVLLSSITGSMFEQKFTVQFRKWDSEPTMERSGNPGYIIGKPIVMARREQNESYSEYVFVPSKQISVFSVTAQGVCGFASNSEVTLVNFGYNLRTGCFVPNDHNCSELRKNMVQLLLGMPLEEINNTFIAAFGNYDVLQSTDWLPIIFEHMPALDTKSSKQFSCPNLYNHLVIQIVYSKMGTVLNPQNKILGVRYKFLPPIDIEYPCTANCEMIEASVTVTFIDTTNKPLRKYGEPPDIPAKLPYDFFYPFICSDNDDNSTGCWCLTVFFMLLPGLFWACALTNFLFK